MDKNQESRFNMYNVLLRFLDENSAATTGAVPLLATKDELAANVLAMNACVKRQVVDIRGFAEAKALAEELMVGRAVVVAKATLAYAVGVGNTVLAGQMRVSRRLLQKHADGVVARHCTGVLDTATLVGADLVAYGVDAARLAKLQEAIEAYDAQVMAPRLALTARKGATTELRLLMRDTAKLVSTRLDGLMERYRMEAPAFHRGYLDARIVVDRGARTSAAPVEKAA